jgi:hypothetical protein
MNEKVSLIIKIYIWFYRLIGMTFGGLVINSNEKLVSNKLLKYYGILTFILIAMSNFYGVINGLKSPQLISSYESGFMTLYLMILLIMILRLSLIFLNYLYSNLNGIEFFYALKNIEINKNQRLLFALWIVHILTPIGMQFTIIYSTNLLRNSSLIYIITYSSYKTLGFVAIWTFPFLTWINSINSYGVLRKIKKVLNDENFRKPGDFFLKLKVVMYRFE